MKRLMTVLGAMAVVGLMAGTACADLTNFQLGMNEFCLSNCSYPMGAAFQPGGWTATTNGALWIATGGGPPVLNTQDLNFELDYRATPTSAWITVTNTYLLSNGVAQYDCSIDYYAYPGEFEGVDNTFGVPADHASPYRYLYAGSAEYVLPGTGPTTDYPYGEPTQEGMQFDLYAWTGNFNTFAAATAGGAQVAVSGPFQVGTTSYSIYFWDTAFSYMPSMVLTLPGDANYDGKVDINDLTIVLAHYGQTDMTWSQGDFNNDGKVDINDLTIVLAHYRQSVGSSLAAVPEPASVFLLGVGAISLFAYAWRKPRRTG